MNYRLIFSTLARVIRVEAILLLLPLAVSAIYGENCFYAFLITAVGAYLLGTVLKIVCKPKTQYFYSKDGLITVALTWLSVSVIGAIPFVISGEIPSFIDAFFETVSGFTTTGATILENVEGLSNGLLFWRSFTHWIGGMGVLVFIMAITSKTTDRPIHILRAEMPGPSVDKLVPSSKDTAKILYLIYVVLTVVLIILLWLGDMNLFESVIHAFGTAGTGGFGVKNNSIVNYSSYSQWVIAIFMLIFGMNFNLFYLILIKKVGTALKSTELRYYLFIVLTSTVLITFNIYPAYENAGEAIRHAFFQTSSIMTTTGFSTQDFNAWPTLSKIILFVLMLIGGCSGSTAGGFKVSRLVVIFKKIKAELKKVLHPNTISVIKMDGEKVSDGVLGGIVNYLAVYVVCFISITLLISFDGFDFEATFSATAACFNNVGPAFSVAGPMCSYADFTPFSKIILSLAMLLGRLEIYPLLLALTPSTWFKK
ncbi:MAG: TrkH family potassium uptake protein [Clostridia bacterium]|nr:TrkH family potassium uptake protein [Clostridia bacterium]